MTDEILAELRVYDVAALGTRYDEGDTVTYGDGSVGIVLEVHTEPFEVPGTGEQTDASTDSPVYVVALEDSGIGPMRASDLEMAEEDALRPDDADVEDPTEAVSDADLAAFARPDDDGIEELDPGVGWDDYPDSWEESDRPARLILLDMWLDMNASFTGCVREMRGRIRDPEGFCGKTKDQVYGTEAWRS